MAVLPRRARAVNSTFITPSAYALHGPPDLVIETAHESYGSPFPSTQAGSVLRSEFAVAESEPSGTSPHA